MTDNLLQQRVHSAKFGALLVVGAMILGACAQSNEPAEPYRVISDLDEFTTLFVDKPISRSSGAIFVINSDGTVGGDISGTTPEGTWRWENDTYCRAFKIDAKDFPYECQKVEVRGTTARFTRADGTISDGWQLGA